MYIFVLKGTFFGSVVQFLLLKAYVLHINFNINYMLVLFILICMQEHW